LASSLRWVEKRIFFVLSSFFQSAMKGMKKKKKKMMMTGIWRKILEMIEMKTDPQSLG